MLRILLHFFKKRRHATEEMPFKLGLFFVILIWYAASGFMYFEVEAKPDLKWSDALWWAIVTMTTIGYGDFFPATAGGRFIIGLPTMIFGVGLLGYALSEIASNLIESKSRRLQGMTDHRINDHVIIVNFPSLEKAMKLIDEIRGDRSTSDKKICLIDEQLPEIPKELNDAGVLFVRGNPTRESVLKRACLSSASHAVILSKDPSDPHSDDQNLATILMMEHLNRDVITVAECVDPDKIDQLRAAGCDRIVCISGMSTNILVQELQNPGIQAILNELTSNAAGSQIYTVDIESLNSWKSDSIEAWARQRGHIFIGILRNGIPLMNPAAGEGIDKTDKAIILGRTRPEQIRG